MLIYLAAPYSHPEVCIRTARFHAVNKVAGALMQEGYIVYSPISHSHPIALDADLPKDWTYWQKTCEVMVSKCDKVVVVKLQGYLESIGVQGEIDVAEKLGIPVEYYDVTLFA